MKTPFIVRNVLPVLVWLCCLSLLYAQGEDSLSVAKAYPNGYLTINALLQTMIWSGAYLLIYAGALVVTLSCLQLFTGFDGSTILRIVALWLGGMVVNYFAFMMAHNHRVLAVLIALPLIFGWGVLINTRSFADLITRDAVRVSIVVALICTPYFGPTWHFTPIKPLDPNLPSDDEGGRLTTPAQLARAYRACRIEQRDNIYDWNTAWTLAQHHPLRG